MARNVELLLLESVDHLGIVGDVVKVRTGFARNFLLPRGLADTPSDEMIASLAEKRAVAQRDVAERRKQRESMIDNLDGYVLEVEKNANELGLLYGSVSQHEIAQLLTEKGFPLRDRDVRLAHTIKRVDSYDVVIRPESDLQATIKLVVKGTGQEYLEGQEARKAAEKADAEAEAAAKAARAQRDQQVPEEAGV